MKKIFLLLLFVLNTLFASDEMMLECANAYKSVIRSGKVPANELVSVSSAIIIFPSFYKGGFFIGGWGGKGVMLEKASGSWNGVGVGIGGASLGFQVGFENNMLVIFVLKDEIVADIKSGKFTISAELAASFGRYGANASNMNEMSFTKSLYAYANNSGLFAGLNFGGSVIGSNDEIINTDSYGFRELVGAIGAY